MFPQKLSSTTFHHWWL